MKLLMQMLDPKDEELFRELLLEEDDEEEQEELSCILLQLVLELEQLNKQLEELKLLDHNLREEHESLKLHELERLQCKLEQQLEELQEQKQQSFNGINSFLSPSLS